MGKPEIFTLREVLVSTVMVHTNADFGDGFRFKILEVGFCEDGSIDADVPFVMITLEDDDGNIDIPKGTN